MTETELLQKLDDTLLPKLMNGEVRVASATSAGSVPDKKLVANERPVAELVEATGPRGNS